MEAEHQAQRVAITQARTTEGVVIAELLPGEDEALQFRRDALPVLDLRLQVRDVVIRFQRERDGLPGERPQEELHPSARPGAFKVVWWECGMGSGARRRAP